MTDIVERLRSRPVQTSEGPGHNMLDLEAADTIEQLRAAADDALATLEAIELLDAARFGLKPEAVTASCDALRRALEAK